MFRTLRLTSALTVVTLLSSHALADTPKVTVGGFSDFHAGITNDDQDANLRSLELTNDNEISVSVDGKVGALSYGAVIDIEADTTDDGDSQGTNAARTFTYLEGSWGRVEMGDVESAAASMRQDASTIAVASGGINGA